MLIHVVLSVLPDDEIGIYYEQYPHGDAEVDVYLYAMVGFHHISNPDAEHLKRMREVLERLGRVLVRHYLETLDREVGSKVQIGTTGRRQFVINASPEGIRQTTSGFGLLGGKKARDASPRAFQAFGWFMANLYRDDDDTLDHLSSVASHLSYLSGRGGISLGQVPHLTDMVMKRR
jgi:hypothetical protein